MRKFSMETDQSKKNNPINSSTLEVEQAEQLDKTESENRPKEIGGPKGLEPTRYGDWEKKGRCIDF